MVIVDNRDAYWLALSSDDTKAVVRKEPIPEGLSVFTASETLLDFQRTAIAAAFDAPVFNWYGNTEMTCNIIGCAAGRLHYRTDYGYLELDEHSQLIATGLHNRAMPLIR